MDTYADSDTESESQISVSAWDVTEYTHISTALAGSTREDGGEDVPSPAEAIHLVAEELRSLDLSAIENVCPFNSPKRMTIRS